MTYGYFSVFFCSFWILHFLLSCTQYEGRGFSCAGVRIEKEGEQKLWCELTTLSCSHSIQVVLFFPFRLWATRDILSSFRISDQSRSISFAQNLEHWSLRKKQKTEVETGKVVLETEEMNENELSDGQEKRKDGGARFLPSLVWQHIIAWRAEYGIARDQVQG